MRRRLRVERMLRVAPRESAMFDHIFDHIGAPAFVVGARGQLLHANQAGWGMLATRGPELTRVLQEAVAGRPGTIEVELTQIVDAGSPVSWLAIFRGGSSDARVASAVESACARWRITPRQRDVLECVLRGNANSTIAAQLGVSLRAIEQHLSALFDKVGAESRAALIAIVLTMT
jgi:DNA-binding NarL/FixJ family response regulator